MSNTSMYSSYIFITIFIHIDGLGLYHSLGQFVQVHLLTHMHMDNQGAIIMANNLDTS